MSGRPADLAILWLGETLLIPHLWPIVDALARDPRRLTMDLWVNISGHEALIRSWLTDAHDGIRVKRAPGFRHADESPAGPRAKLPAKLPMLARLAPHLARVPVVLCAEQTSLWIPRLLPTRTRYILTAHGAGPFNYHWDGRLRYAHRLLAPGQRYLAEHIAHGLDPARILVTGYAKASFQKAVTRASLFPEARPTILYVPHWQAHRSSWWDWGRAIVSMLVRQDRYNVILAPHERLLRRDATIRAFIEEAGAQPHVHVDAGSFALVDGSYTTAADIYLGDSSSQIVEFLANPRPCILLQSPSMTWRAAETGYPALGDTVRAIDALWAAIEAAPARHARYRAAQTSFAAGALGDCSPEAPRRAARAVIEALPGEQPHQPASQDVSTAPRRRAASA